MRTSNVLLPVIACLASLSQGRSISRSALAAKINQEPLLAGHQASQNILQNGDFETGGRDHWDCNVENSATCEISILDPSHGSFRIQSSQSPAASIDKSNVYYHSSAELTQDFVAIPGRHYHLSFDYIFENAQDENLNGGALQVQMNDEPALITYRQRNFALWNTACLTWTSDRADNRFSILMSQLSRTQSNVIAVDNIVLSLEPSSACQG